VFRSDFPDEAPAPPPPAGGGESASPEQKNHLDPEPWQQPKSLGLAVLLSFLLPGLGQLYNGEAGKFGLILLVVIVLAVIATVMPLLLLVNFGIWVWSMVNAYNVAQSINHRDFLRHKKRHQRAGG